MEQCRNDLLAQVEAGLSEAEIQTVIIGPKRRYVYCMKCFEVSEVEEEAEIAECDHCKASLEIGPFIQSYGKVILVTHSSRSEKKK